MEMLTIWIPPQKIPTLTSAEICLKQYGYNPETGFDLMIYKHSFKDAQLFIIISPEMIRHSIMGGLNNCFFLFPKRKKAALSLILAHKGTHKNIVFQSALIFYLN
jgi:hypothetical protein